VRPSVERERRSQLTAAAARVIARKGYVAATLRDVADEAGTSTGTLNYYYQGKDDLFAETLRVASERFQGELAAAVASAASPRDQLVAMARAATPSTAEGRESHAVWIDFWAQAARDEALGELNQRIYDRWRRDIAAIVRAGQAAGVFAPTADPDAFARGYAAVIDGLATHVVLHAGFGPAEMEAACRAYVDAQLYVNRCVDESV
jgi:AcrR family transcriptional regulator